MQEPITKKKKSYFALHRGQHHKTDFANHLFQYFEESQGLSPQSTCKNSIAMCNKMFNLDVLSTGRKMFIIMDALILPILK